MGKILDKSRPPEHRWRYPKPQLFSEVSIDSGTGIPAYEELIPWDATYILWMFRELSHVPTLMILHLLAVAGRKRKVKRSSLTLFTFCPDMSAVL